MSGELDVLFDRINREFGRLDIAFNNTAIENQSGLLPELDRGDLAETIDVNVFGTWQIMRYEIEQMLTNLGGAIVNNSGILSINPQPKKSIESATRAAIASITKAAALEYASAGIRINAIAPGFIKSDRESNNSNKSEISPDLVPMGRLEQLLKNTDSAIAEIALRCGFSDQSSFSTAFRKAVGVTPKTYRDRL